MSEPIKLPDQDDVLATNTRLSAENTRLTAELTAATEDLAVQAKAASDAAMRADALSARLATLEVAAKVAGEELTRLKADNSQLTVQQADFQKAVAVEVQKLGLRPKAAEHKEAPAQTDLTPTQRVLAARGVSSLAELEGLRNRKS